MLCWVICVVSSVSIPQLWRAHGGDKELAKTCCCTAAHLHPKQHFTTYQTTDFLSTVPVGSALLAAMLHGAWQGLL